MNALQACVYFSAELPKLPHALAPFLDVDMKTPIMVRCTDRVGEVEVDLLPPMLAALLEADGRLDACDNADDLTAALTECLLSDFPNKMSRQQLGVRSHELAVEMLDLGLKLKQARENN